MALPQLTRIVAPHLWGWLADRSGRQHAPGARRPRWRAALCWLGMFASTCFPVDLRGDPGDEFFLSAALPLVEATTLTHLGENTGALRRDPGVGIDRLHRRGGRRRLCARFFRRRRAAVDRARVAARHARFCLAGAGSGAAAPHAADQQPIAACLKRPEVIALIVACALMAVAHGPYYTFYSIHLVDHGYSKGLTGWLWALGVICEIAIFLWLPHLYRAFTLRADPDRELRAGGGAVSRSSAGAPTAWRCCWSRRRCTRRPSARFMPRRSASCTSSSAAGTRRAARRSTAAWPSASAASVGSLASGYAWERLGAALTFTAASACALAGMLLIVLETESSPAA